PDGNFAASSSDGSLLVNRADQTITWATPADIVYGTALDSTQLDASVSVVGPAPAGALSYVQAAGTVLNAGNGQVLTVNVAGTDAHTPASATVSINVARATPTISVTPYSVTYDGNSHTATGLATGVNNEDLGAQLTLSGTTHTNAASYTDTWTFTDN